MKQKVSRDQILKYLNQDGNRSKNLTMLDNFLNKDYMSIVNYHIGIEGKSEEYAFALASEFLESDLSLGEMLSVLQNKNIKISMNNLRPATVVVMESNKEYCKEELCDCLWEALIDNI